MKASLSEEQREAIRQIGGLPLQVDDSRSNQVYFLISAEQYWRASQFWKGSKKSTRHSMNSTTGYAIQLSIQTEHVVLDNGRVCRRDQLVRPLRTH